MDQRQQPPHAFPRQQDRPLIQNPNHQGPPPPPPQSHSNLYHPTTSGPPVQIPFSDPFQRRAPDPFLPNTQGPRREGYAISSGRDAGSGGHTERPQLAGAWSGTSSAPSGGTASSTASLLHHQHPQSTAPPPPSLSTAIAGSTPAPYAYDPARRRSVGGHSPPRFYGATSNEPSPSLAAYTNRHMPPPSPSQQPPQVAPFAAGRGPIPPPPFGNGRELPGLGARGTGMSISSILGVDTSSQPPAPPHYSPTATSQSPNSVSMQPPSPRRAQSYTQWRRPQTPEKHPLPAALRAQDNTTYSASSSPRANYGSRPSPENSRTAAPVLHHLYQTSSGPGVRPYGSSPNEQREREQHRPNEDHLPPRPNSQPAGYGPLPRENGPRDSIASLVPRQPVYGNPPFDRRSGQEEQRQPPPPFGDRNGTPATSRDRPITAEPLGHSAYSPPNAQRSVANHEPSRDDHNRDNQARREDYNAPFRTGFRNQYYAPSPGGGHVAEAPRSHPQGMDPFRRPNEGPWPGNEYRPQERPPAPPGQHLQDRRTSEPQPHGAELQHRNSYDQVPMLMQRSRSSLGIGPEGKRGRASPLPQAVQGAQAQLRGPGEDPGIKSEFGRLFGGVGGHIAGISTPSRQSPMPRTQAPDVEPIVLSDGDGVKMARIGSRGPKKGRRVKEEDGKLDGESIDGRGTPLGSGSRGAKRAKVSHHHHLHQHNHAHHHHIHGHVHEDPSRPPSFPNIPNTTPTPSVHHHHHIHPSHHHHHTPRPAPAPVRKPSITVKSQAVLDGIRELPSNHLGNELYAPQITLPPQANARLDDKYGYFALHKLERKFTEADLNCTYTIRVPREHVTSEAREKICTDRYIFGTDIYTDDSDPVAMCVHSGWLRGEWSNDVDTSLMDLPRPPPADEEIEEEMTERPDHPIVPPEDTDLHITLRILPPLQEYKGTVMHGVLSRDYPSGKHDGMSYMVEKLRWVDEGSGRLIARGGKARRARLEAAQSLVAMFLTHGSSSEFKNRVDVAMPMAQVAA